MDGRGCARLLATHPSCNWRQPVDNLGPVGWSLCPLKVPRTPSQSADFILPDTDSAKIYVLRGSERLRPFIQHGSGHHWAIMHGQTAVAIAVLEFSASRHRYLVITWNEQCTIAERHCRRHYVARRDTLTWFAACAKIDKSGSLR